MRLRGYDVKSESLKIFRLGSTITFMSKKPYPSEEQDRFIVRLPSGMRDRIRLLAEDNGRSMNAQIVFMMQRYFDNLDAEVSALEDGLSRASQEASATNQFGKITAFGLLSAIAKLEVELIEQKLENLRQVRTLAKLTEPLSRVVFRREEDPIEFDEWDMTLIGHVVDQFPFAESWLDNQESQLKKDLERALLSLDQAGRDLAALPRPQDMSGNLDSAPKSSQSKSLPAGDLVASDEAIAASTSKPASVSNPYAKHIEKMIGVLKGIDTRDPPSDALIKPLRELESIIEKQAELEKKGRTPKIPGVNARTENEKRPAPPRFSLRARVKK